MSNTNKLLSRALVITGLAAAGALPAVLPFVSSGCGTATCTPESNDPSKPAVSIECPAGTLCYQGACVETCNAGGELVDECTEDGDCPESGRPYCNQGFCSSCEEPTQCIPQLDVCATVTDIEIDAGNQNGEKPNANSPLDGGPLDIPSYDPLPEAVDLEPLRWPPTHTGTIVIAQRWHSQDSNRREAIIEFETADLRGTNRRAWEYARDVSSSSVSLGNCAVIRRENWTIAQPRVDLGEVIINMPDVNDRKTNKTYKLVWDGNEYFVDPRPPPDFLPYSEPQEPDTYPEELRVAGKGNAETNGDWPDDVSQGDLHVPRRLDPTPGAGGSQEQLSRGLQWNVDPNKNSVIKLAWQAQFFKSGTRLSAMEEGVTVRITVRGDKYDVDCREDEEDLLSVALDSRAMDYFLDLEGYRNNPPATPLPLYFERVFEVRVPVRADEESPSEGGITIHVAARISHTHVSTMEIVR